MQRMEASNILYVDGAEVSVTITPPACRHSSYNFIMIFLLFFNKSRVNVFEREKYNKSQQTDLIILSMFSLCL